MRRWQSVKPVHVGATMAGVLGLLSYLLPYSIQLPARLAAARQDVFVHGGRGYRAVLRAAAALGRGWRLCYGPALPSKRGSV